MGSIVFTDLKNTGKTDSGYTYTDLHLDVMEANVYTNSGKRVIKSRDIRVDYDEEAIRNSIVNIFTTMPGQRFLIPTFGINLKQYLFEPVNKQTGQRIGETILKGIEDWEPRVTVDLITVKARGVEDIVSKNNGSTTAKLANSLVSSPTSNGEYDITIAITIPALKKKINLSTALSDVGFAETKIATQQ